MNATLSDSSLIAEAIGSHRQRLLSHPIYGDLRQLGDLRCFMEYHVFAVWDFMSLLKALQRELTCVSVPWLPTGDPAARSLINQIVLGEESDTDSEGRTGSHFELYLEAMQEVGADTSGIERFIVQLRRGINLEEALERSGAPACVRQFVNQTFAFISQAGIHETAAAFTYGREDLIPGLFGEIVTGLNASSAGQLEKFRYYLDRHIELDGNEHGELGRQMVATLCGDDSTKWEQAARAAATALASRVQLWDGIHAAIVSRAR